MVYLQDVITLISCLTEQANVHGYSLEQPSKGSWAIQTVTPKSLQTTTFSCGLWVLATIGAVLSGKHVTGMTEDDISLFRTALVHHVLGLPVFQ